MTKGFIKQQLKQKTPKESERSFLYRIGLINEKGWVKQTYPCVKVLNKDGVYEYYDFGGDVQKCNESLTKLHGNAKLCYTAKGYDNYLEAMRELAEERKNDSINKTIQSFNFN